MTYTRLTLRDGKKVILRDMRAADAKVIGEIVTGVEVNRHGDTKESRRGGKRVDETLHIIGRSTIQSIETLVMSPKYATLVTIAELQQECSQL